MDRRKLNIYNKLRSTSNGVIEPYIVHPDVYSVTYTNPDRVYFLGQNVVDALQTLQQNLRKVRDHIRQKPSLCSTNRVTLASFFDYILFFRFQSF